MQAMATIFGGLIAGYFIHNKNPFDCFLALSFVALICALSGFFIDTKLETERVIEVTRRLQDP